MTFSSNDQALEIVTPVHRKFTAPDAEPFTGARILPLLESAAASIRKPLRQKMLASPRCWTLPLLNRMAAGSSTETAC
jgi:hypothetical protein